MEKEEEKNKKTALKRRIKTYSSILNSSMPPPEGEKRWILIAGGVLLLTIVAFLSGIRLGKDLQELKSGQVISPSFNVAKEIEKKDPPYKLAEPEGNQRSLLSLKEKAKIIKPEEPGTTSQVPEKINPSPAKAKYTLQIAALNNMEEAKQMVNQLQNKGYAAYQISGRGAAKGTLYRVRIGYFNSLQEAREFALKFEKKEKIKPLITSASGEH